MVNAIRKRPPGNLLASSPAAHAPGKRRSKSVSVSMHSGIFLSRRRQSCQPRQRVRKHVRFSFYRTKRQVYTIRKSPKIFANIRPRAATCQIFPQATRGNLLILSLFFWTARIRRKIRPKSTAAGRRPARNDASLPQSKAIMSEARQAAPNSSGKSRPASAYPALAQMTAICGKEREKLLRRIALPGPPPHSGAPNRARYSAGLSFSSRRVEADRNDLRSKGQRADAKSRNAYSPVV
jgi:hypothetical protein